MRIRKNHWKLAFTASVVIAFLASAFASVSLSGLTEESTYSSPTTTTIFSDAIPPDPNEGSGNPNGIHQAVFPQVASGDEYLCAAAEDRTVWCWGLNHFGQLGNGTYTDSNTPTQVPGIATATQISAGNDHTCTRLEDGTIRCWGSNFTGQLGNNTTARSNTPVQVSGITTAVQVSAGFDHTCAVLADGTIRCWGRNQNGQLGNGSHTRSTTPARVSGITTGVQVSSGYYHTCAVLEDGTVQCWGRNHHGQSGQSDVIDTNTPNSVSNVHRATQVSVGLFHTCALLEDGTVSCWGENAFGQLGDGVQEAIDSDDRPDTTQAPTAKTYTSHNPLLVGGINTATRISAGDDHTCAVLADETVRCWGSNFGGQLGNGAPIAHSDTPVQAWGIATATQISAGNNYSCAVTEDRTIKCWGYNNPRTGKPGDGTIIGSTPPSSILWIIPSPPGTANPQIRHQKISAAQHHSCAVLEDGTIKCWGGNYNGQLGNGTDTATTHPVFVQGIDNAIAVSTGTGFTCALLEDKTVKCWGSNTVGQLGDGTNILEQVEDGVRVSATYIDPPTAVQVPIASHTPVLVSGINNAVGISAGAGRSSTCAILEDGTVKCWGSTSNTHTGSNSFGQNSESLRADIQITPVVVPEITGAVEVSIGVHHICFLIEDGTVKCQGDNRFSQLGYESRYRSATPVLIPEITTATQISAGSRHNCALLADRTIKCWGYNAGGRLGNGSDDFKSHIPVEVPGINTATYISTAAGNHTCAVLADGTIKCWGGFGLDGKLGNGTRTDGRIPVLVSGITTGSQVSAGTFHTCALLEDKTNWCWGHNYYGQLGDGTVSGSSIPVLVLEPLSPSLPHKVSAAFQHTCLLLESGRIQCWGSGGHGKLGNGRTNNSQTPVSVIGIDNAVDIYTGGDHNCALLADGTVKCWGWNYVGQLGNGTNSSSSLPVSVVGIDNAVALSTGVGRDATCAILEDGTVKCWGRNAHGLVKDAGEVYHHSQGSEIPYSSTPVPVPGINTAVQVEIGGSTACILLEDGTIRCLGRNTYGYLWPSSENEANRFSPFASTPVQVPGITGVAQISIGSFRICVLLNNGTIKCWGNANHKGGIGPTSGGTSFRNPLETEGISTATMFGTGTAHSCALLENGTIKCWGKNSAFQGHELGHLGDGSGEDSLTTPVLVSGITTATQISVGKPYTCAILEDKTVWCWGPNWAGQLGNGESSRGGKKANSLTPTMVIGAGQIS